MNAIRDSTNSKTSPGTKETERLPHPLRAGFLRIRPLSLAEQFCKAGRIAGADDIHQRTAASISPLARLFHEEPAFILSQLVSFNADDEAQRFDIALEEDPEAALEQIGALAGRLRNWLAQISRSGLTDFSKQIAQLNAEADLQGRLERLAKGQASYVLDAVRTSGLVPPTTTPRNGLQQALAIDTALRAAHALLRNAIVTLQPIAAQAFERRITAGDMDPALGLLLAELAAAERVDDQINAFVHRLTYHYYEEVIGQHPAGPSEERILLHLPKTRRRGILTKGATLQARDTGGVLQKFETEASVPVSTARLKRTAVLCYDTDPKISFNAALGGITGVRAKEYPPGPRAVPPPTFSPVVAEPVDMGLDISSTMFSLAEGERVIEVSLNMKRSSNLPAVSSFVPYRLRDRSGKAPAVFDPELVLALRSDPDLLRAFHFTDLEEGIRNIAQRVHDRARETNHTVSLMMVYEVLIRCAFDLNALRMVLGRIVTLSLIEKQPLPDGDFWEVLEKKVDACRKALGAQQSAEQARMRRENPAIAASFPRETMIFEAFERDKHGNFLLSPQDIFEKLLSDVFEIKVTTAEGPLTGSVTQVLSNFQKGVPGITIKLSLDDAMPPVVGPTPKDAPVFSIRYAPAARICPVSFFERYHIPNILVRVRASGLKRIHGFADDGPMTTDQTFAPFGARPKDGGTFWVGCPELAVKPVTHVGLDITWADLPGPDGGFEGHYAHYPRRSALPDPKIELQYLSRDGWKPLSPGPQRMFLTDTAGGRLRRNWHFSGPLFGQTVPAFGLTSEQNFASRQSVRAGVIAMRISDTGAGFLADDYPLALVKSVRPRVLPERLVGARPVPPAPFVPKVAQMSLSYTAEAIIELNSPKTARTGERVVQVGPFGQIEVFPRRALRRVRLFPERLGYGHLFIQIDGEDATGPLTLVFDAADSGHLRRVPEPNPIDWYYLTDAGWTPLPASAIQSDSTAGLMRSGLVALDLPEDAVHSRSDMPAGGVWLVAVATLPKLSNFPRLAQVDTNGVWARRSGHELGHPQGRAWAFDPPQQGIGLPREVPTFSDVRPEETAVDFVARVGERLRHRKRGITPWDIERLVLDAFPEVWMVKCLPHLDQDIDGPAPGHATVVVVRKAPKSGPNNIRSAHLFDVGTLNRVRDHLAALCPAFARIDVVNPSFQRIQVRATLRFDSFEDSGAMTQRLAADLNDYLSVWTGPPEVSRFDWSINRKLLRAHIGALDYVRGISDFSVLHLAQDDVGHHALIDTAQDDATYQTPADSENTDFRHPTRPVYIRPAHPWSLPIAAAQHALRTVHKAETDIETQSGIGRLAVGDMLIVRQGVKT